MDQVAAYILTWTDGIIGQTHLFAALTALISGGVVVFMRKGTIVHVLLGYAYLVAMILVNTSALLKYDLSGKPNMFHVFALISIVTIYDVLCFCAEI